MTTSTARARRHKAVDPNWIVAAADRAERHSRGEAPSLFRQAADRTTPATQLEQLIDAIADRRVTRKELLQLAERLT
jgi:hypothetical protein